ncbi:class I poly(R)-hydroxyalkanoic acid synthase [Sneathiella sp. HT1-7]|uniref:class I poly(R)-hydroxyalkanoic acid synthase n=1 Tax=Sneathiella sp. HT1-7 TaxID=2887192 RepID=UPI001D13FCAC|nr:class I poly(R)-hydroxyalkanoic acid synthase [Sneathiella sp. HT1-7]MCC3304809.1 class I poly(R)-hydroxyalkanoic acid synthase [Sneathiella sp. HT1-7]
MTSKEPLESSQEALEASKEFAENFAKIAAQSQEVVTEFLNSQQPTHIDPDPATVSKTFMELMNKMMADPAKIVEAQAALWKNYMNLWQNAAMRASGEETPPLVTPQAGDKRFKSDEWSENQIFDYIKQSYLMTANWIQETVSEVEGLDKQTKTKADFYTKLYTDAMSPSNFFWSNPDVLKKTIESKGENLVHGLENMLDDLKRTKGQLIPKMTDEDAFEVGRNIAVTPGKVIYENDLMQLIQYAPATKEVYKRPLLITPPWINKFYILDLKSENSFIKWCTEQGYTVFVISWVNPDERHVEKTFESYMAEGILAALDAIETSTGEREVTTIGYCIGGTLMATTLAYLAAIGEEDRIKATTFFAAQLDFEDAGDLLVFTDEDHIQLVESKMKGGYLEGKEMANTFNLLRSNDLIWSFVINNYMMGKSPFPFDLLYWNTDATNMPHLMHSFYLRNMYQKNLLRQPGALTFGGQPIDLSKVKTPIFIQASKEDHIAPFKSVFKNTQLFSGPTELMLAGSGHIAGVINHPDANKYQYWTNTKKKKKYETAEEWFADAKEHPGSWWPYWDKWLSKKSGPKVPARDPAKGKLKPIEDAPGSYVKVKAKPYTGDGGGGE